MHKREKKIRQNVEKTNKTEEKVKETCMHMEKERKP